MKHSVNLNISQAKMKKLLKGLNVTLTHDELGVGHPYEVEKKILTKINRAIRNNKGLRINKDMIDLDDTNDTDSIDGGKINLKINLKKLVNNQGVDALEGIKKVVPKSVAKSALSSIGSTAGLAIGAYAGNATAGQKIGKNLGASVADGYYDTNFRDKNALKDFGQSTGESFAKNGIKDIMSGQGLVNGINPRGAIYINGNPNLKNKKSTDTIWNDNNLRNHKSISGGSFIVNGASRTPTYGRGLDIADVKYHEMRSDLMRDANLPNAYLHKKRITGGSFTH
jgi:hypothetical protein